MKKTTKINDLSEIEFDTKFTKLISFDEIGEIIGTEFDNSHYYYFKLFGDETITAKVKSITDESILSINVGSFMVNGEKYNIKFSGVSRITSFGKLMVVERHDTGLIKKGSFGDIVKLINDNHCIEESVPFFTVKKDSLEEGYILTHDLISVSLFDIIMFKKEKENS